MKQTPRIERADDPRITAEKIDGVWVFFHGETPQVEGAKQASAQARYSGAPSISQGCLYVGDHIVVWGRLRYDEVREAIENTRKGRPATIVMSGYGTGAKALENPTRLHRVITKRCDTKSIWWANLTDG